MKLTQKIKEEGYYIVSVISLEKDFKGYYYCFLHRKACLFSEHEVTSNTDEAVRKITDQAVPLLSHNVVISYQTYIHCYNRLDNPSTSNKEENRMFAAVIRRKLMCGAYNLRLDKSIDTYAF